MPIRQNKNSLHTRRGVTLIEVMIVLAISGLLVVAAIATLGSHNSVLFEAGVQNVVNDIRTVVNEARSGLGPAGSQITNPNDPDAYMISGGIPGGWAIFGEAVEFDNNCGSGGAATQSCLRVYKLMKSTNPTVHNIIPYERYTSSLPSNLQFVFGGGGAGNPMVVYTNTGPAYSFTKTSGINGGPSGVAGINSASSAFTSSSAATDTNYINSTAPTVSIQDRSSATKSAVLHLDMTNPINVTADMP